MSKTTKRIRQISKENKIYQSGLSAATFPTVPLFPHQRKAFNIFVNSRCFSDQLAKEGKKPNRYTSIFLSWPRRAGKDFFAFQCAITYCLSSPLRSVYYFFPELRQALEVIFDGSMSRPFPSPDPAIRGMPVKRYIDLVPKQFLASVNKKDSVIHFTNGSKIYFGSLTRSEKRRGSGAGLCIASEFAFSSEGCLDPIFPMLEDAKGMMIYITTPPQFKNHSYNTWTAERRNDPNIFSDIHDKIKSNAETNFSHTELLTAPQLCDQYGRRIVSDEFIEKERDRMSDSYVNREYFCNWTAGGEGAVYAKTMADIRAQGAMLDNIPFIPGAKLYAALDIGATDHTSIVYAQVVGQTVQFLDHLIDSKKTIHYYIDEIKKWQQKYNVKLDNVFGPHDINYKNVGMTTLNQNTGQHELTTVAEIARRMGVELTFVAKPREKIGAVAMVRIMLHRSQFIDTRERCGLLIRHLEQLHFKKDASTGDFTDQIIRGKEFCHSCDAVQTLALGLETQQPGYLTSLEPVKVYKKPDINQMNWEDNDYFETRIKKVDDRFDY